MIDAVFAQLRGMAEAWTREAARRRQISGVDPVADTLGHCATELAQQLLELEADMGFLSVEDYARLHKVTPQTVRTWIRDGELPAVRTDRGAYQIRRDAKRKRSA